jgi:cytochrome P450
MAQAPCIDLDPFADDFLRDPDPQHERLREAGPVVFLERYGVWAMARFAQVHAALRDHETFCSGPAWASAISAGRSDGASRASWGRPIPRSTREPGARWRG